MLIFDCEIKRAIPGKAINPTTLYCDGWHDFDGMGIACICAFDTVWKSTHVFMGDNLDRFKSLVKTTPIIGYNSDNFDIPLLLANGFKIGQSYDLLSQIKTTLQIDPADHPKGYSLTAVARANIGYGKTGNGADAPMLFQTGQFGSLIDYCLWDVYLLSQLMDIVTTYGELVDPINSRMIPVSPPIFTPEPPQILSPRQRSDP